MSEISDQLIDRLLAQERTAVRGSALVVRDELDFDYLPLTRFAQLVVTNAMPHTARFGWSSVSASRAALDVEQLATSSTERYENALFDLDPVVGGGCLLYVFLSGSRVFGRGAATEPGALERAEAWLRERLPEVEPTEDQEVPIEFWTGSQCPASTMRLIEVPSWSDVASNYPRALRERLEPLIAPEWRPGSGGQLLLWHGPPGTGKTHALRALAWEWRAWCSLHYVTDPERFFGNASYMLDVLLGEDDDDERWRLLVLEDTGELLTADAKERSGQGLSRLLNVVDGIIGQGLRVLILVTTNEPLGALHPAVSRPGRCAALLEFGAFTPDEAHEWLVERGAVDARGASATLAELYARLAGAPVEERRRVGFVH